MKEFHTVDRTVLFFGVSLTSNLDFFVAWTIKKKIKLSLLRENQNCPVREIPKNKTVLPV